MTGANERKFDKRSAVSNRGKTRSTAGSDIEFVNRELSSEETDHYREWRADLDNLTDEMDRMLQNGYKISVKFDDYSDSYAAFLFPPIGDDNEGKCLTGRGGNSYRALSEAVYKHVVIFGGNWAVTGRSVRPADDPDW